MKFTKIVLLTFLAYSLLSGCITMPKKSETTFLSGKDIGPARFTPDGNEIVFSIRTEKSSNIYKVKTDGMGLVALTKGDTFDFDPVYSPDGAKILFSSISNNKQADLCLMKPDGSEKIFLTTGPEHDFNPIFSPDGKRIFFYELHGGETFLPSQCRHGIILTFIPSISTAPI
ncbi:MAG: hypothetical protein MPW14_22655 [Candidatus Manganitrophus sp.]|nr:MAG: hypothetical protein MPW14_22655 [Candidatus Manganitrophus sp.]